MSRFLRFASPVLSLPSATVAQSQRVFARVESRFLVLSLAALLVAVACPLAEAQTVTTTVTAGTVPFAVAVNPVTNKIYVANNSSNDVTVIDGATNTTSTVTAGTGPTAVAVNPVTNKIYVANLNSNNVTVIDGATNLTSTVTVGMNPTAVAVNPVTNKIYVANLNSNNVTVIDGVANTTTSVVAGTNPIAIAINPITNNIYVANLTSTFTGLDPGVWFFLDFFALGYGVPLMISAYITRFLIRRLPVIG